MENLKLEQLVIQQIQNLKKGIVDKRITSYTDFKNKYVILKPSVTIEVELTDGIRATIDVTDYFRKEVE